MNTIIVILGLVLILLLLIYLVKRVIRSTKIGTIGKVFSIIGISLVLFSAFMLIIFSFIENLIIAISGLVLILLLAIYLINEVLRSKKELVWKVLLIIGIPLILFYPFMSILISLIAKAKGIFQ